MTLLLSFLIVFFASVEAVRSASEMTVLSGEQMSGQLLSLTAVPYSGTPYPEYVIDPDFMALVNTIATARRPVVPNLAMFTLRNPLRVDKPVHLPAIFTIDSGKVSLICVSSSDAPPHRDLLELPDPDYADKLGLLPGGTCESPATGTAKAVKGFATVASIALRGPDLSAVEGQGYPRNITFVPDTLHKNILGLSFMYETGWGWLPGIGEENRDATAASSDGSCAEPK